MQWINYKSIIISVIYFTVLLLANSVLLINQRLPQNLWLIVPMTALIYLSPGYLAASIAKKYGVVNASLSGLLVTLLCLLAIILIPIKGDTNGMLLTFLHTVIWFGLGAVIWHIKEWVKSLR